MILPIVTLPTTSLRRRSQEIDREFLITSEFKELVKIMVEADLNGDGFCQP